MGKKVAVLIRDKARQYEGLRSSLGLLLEDHAIDMFVLDHEIDMTEEYFDNMGFIDEMGGAIALEVLIDTRTENGLQDPATLDRIARAASEAIAYRDGEVEILKAVSLVDVAPTSLGLLGLPIAEGFDGIDLTPLSATSVPERFVFFEEDHRRKEVGPNRAWTNGEKVHTRVLDFERQGLGETHQRELRRGVDGLTRCRDPACNRCHEHHPAPLSFDHRGQQRLREVERPQEVDAQHSLHFVDVAIEHGAVCTEARIVDEQFDRAELRSRALGGREDLLAIGHVAGKREGFAATRADFTRKRVECVDPPGHQHHARTEIGETLREQSADSARGTGHERGHPVVVR